MLEITPLTPAIGAVISGIDISQGLTDEQVGEIRQAYLNHSVIFFRDQSLSPDQLVKFSARFGKISFYPFVEGMPEHPEVVEVVKRKDEKVNFGGLWHTDTSYLERPPMGSVLYAKQVPAAGGDTLFANMYLAYDMLSDGMKALLEDKRTICSAEKPDAAVTRVHRIAESPKDADEIVTEASHPIVRTHPETGRKALYCSDAHSIRIDGLTAEESRPILQYLYSLQQRPEISCRWHWENGSVAFWDNRCAQHNAL
ncbi:MAG: TauD/TfdA family dioxygenase [Pseudomonadota bacterium]